MREHELHWLKLSLMQQASHTASPCEVRRSVYGCTGVHGSGRIELCIVVCEVSVEWKVIRRPLLFCVLKLVLLPS